MKKLKQELQDRGLLYQFSSEDLFEKFDEGNGVFYCGFDPTADSLHLGNFIGFMVGVHIMRRGNKYIALTGGATGMIGDPGGKDSERNFLTTEVLDNNQKAISNQISRVLENMKSFTGNDFKYDFVNNKDFYEGMGFLDFLREVGKFITVNTMINKESVKKRIEDPDKSISYTEFSYQLLQGYDYCKLFKDSSVTLQIGGSDQWGNLVTGTELIRKKYDKEAYALTWPLITDSTGKKFGKSEGNAMFLEKTKTTPYFIYQYFMNTSDEDLSKYMKMLTLIETEEIDEIVENHMKKPEDRIGQKRLAYEIVKILHGKKEAIDSLYKSGVIFGWLNDFLNSANNGFNEYELSEIEKGKPESVIKLLINSDKKVLIELRDSLGGFDYSGENLFETIVKSGLESSNSNARNAIKSGAIFINEEKVEDFNLDLSTKFINDNVLLLRKGKKSFRIITKK